MIGMSSLVLVGGGIDEACKKVVVVNRDIVKVVGDAVKVLKDAV
jgi:hypothetical protein